MRYEQAHHASNSGDLKKTLNLNRIFKQNIIIKATNINIAISTHW